MIFRTYSELIRLSTFEERLEYLRQTAVIGDITFGGNRFVNQSFYKSPEWLSVRDAVIVRDDACDMALKDFPIGEGRPIYVHHIKPLVIDDFIEHSDFLLNPEFLVCVSFDTHNAVHYGTKKIDRTYRERRPYDTCPWR